MMVSEEIDNARRIAFMIASAAHGLRISLPSTARLEQQLDAILYGAADTPTAVTPHQFDLVYRLRGVDRLVGFRCYGNISG